MKFGKQFLADAALGEWIRKNPEKCFGIATLEGIHTFKSKFSSHEEIQKERNKQEKIKAMFTYDEASNISEDVLRLLKTKTIR